MLAVAPAFATPLIAFPLNSKPCAPCTTSLHETVFNSSCVTRFDSTTELLLHIKHHVFRAP